MNIWEKLQKPFTILAPMEDVTDVVFRSVVEHCGRSDLFFTEFTNVEGMASPKGRDKVIHRLEKTESQQPIIAQIWGRNPENYFQATKDIIEMGFDGVDINMGCPVKKVVKNATCSALIDHPNLAKEIIQATQEAADGKIPVSVKTRLGFSEFKTEEWLGFLLNLKLDAITVHGRIAKHMSKYPANWEEIGRVVKMKNEINPETIIIGNGDITSLEQAEKMYELHGVDGVMIGRGIFQDPFVFNKGKSIYDLDLNERLDLILFHTDKFVEKWGDDKNFQILRRFYKIYLHGLENSNELKNKFLQTNSRDDVLEIINELKVL